MSKVEVEMSKVKRNQERVPTSNQTGDPMISVKHLVKDYRDYVPTKCESCNTPLPRPEKWKKLCTKCYYKKKDLDEKNNFID